MLFGEDRPFHRTDLQANPTVDTGRKINPVPVCALLVFTGAFVDAGDRAGIYTVGHPFTDVRYDGMRHSFYKQTPMGNDYSADLTY